MANAKKCDRCGAFYVAAKIDRRIAIDVLKDHTWYIIDICDNCYKELQKFIGFDKADEEVDE